MRARKFTAEVHAAMQTSTTGGPADGSWRFEIRDAENGLFVEIVLTPEQFAKVPGNRVMVNVRGTYYPQGAPGGPIED